MQTSGQHEHHAGRPLPFGHRLAHRLALAGWRGSHLAWKFVTLMVPLEAGLYRLPDGRFHVLEIDDWISRTTYYGQYERDIFQCLGSLLSRDDTVLDIGANKGVFAAMASKFIGPQGYILCVEPSPLCWETLNSVTALLPPEVEILTYAVDAESGNRSLYFPINPTHSGQATLNSEAVTFATEKRVVPTTSLDQLVGASSRTFTLAKIDVEGAEPEIIKGASQTLQDPKVDILLIEISPQFISNTWLIDLWDKTAEYPFKFEVMTQGILRRKSDLTKITLENALRRENQWYLVASRHSIHRP